MGRAAMHWLAAAIRLLPPRRRELGEGLLAEATSVPPGRARWAWLAGGMWFVAGQVLVYRCAYWLALFGAAALVTVLNWIGTSDDAPQVVLAVLLAAAAGLGWAAPRRVWLSGLVIGSALPVTALIQAALGGTSLLPKPGGLAGAATLFVLLVPALAGAYLGAGAHRLRGRAGRPR
jgi:hypothetical protein